eukprot:SAG11_NODE_68_length_18649_cov_29.058005_11_plen_416_part_00
MVQLNTVAASIEDKMRSIVFQQNAARISRLVIPNPLIEYSRFEGYEFFANRIEGGTGIGVSPEANRLGGNEIMTEAPPLIDFTIVNRARASFEGKALPEASDFIDLCLKLCEQVEGREGMPPRTKKLHVETIIIECFVDSVPPARDPIWKACKSTDAQRLALRRVHLAMCTFSSACMSLPADIDASGVRSTTIMTMFTVFDAILRNSIGKTPLALAAELASGKVCINLVSFDNSLTDYAAATNVLQFKNPATLRARHEACLYLATTEQDSALFRFDNGCGNGVFSYTSKEDCTLKFVREFCGRDDPFSKSQDVSDMRVADVARDAPAFSGIEIPREGSPTPPPNHPGSFENVVGWLMDDGEALHEWAWFRNAAFLVRIMLSPAPKIDRGIIHSVQDVRSQRFILLSRWSSIHDWL